MKDEEPAGLVSLNMHGSASICLALQPFLLNVSRIHSSRIWLKRRDATGGSVTDA